MVGCGGAEVIDRAHDIQRAELSASGRDHRAHLQTHGGPSGNARLPPRRRVLRAESNACVEHLSRVDGVPYQVVDFAEFLREPSPR